MLNFFSHLADFQQLTQSAIQKARRLHQERNAGQSDLQPEEFLSNAVFNVFDSTLSRLSSGDVNQSWWQNLFSVLGSLYVTPDFLREREVQQWLEEPQVKKDLKTLAWSTLIAAETQETRQRLRAKFSEVAQSEEYLADQLIDMIVLVLIGGYLAEMTPGEQLIAASVSVKLANLQQGVDDLLGRADRDPVVTKAHDDQAIHELHRIQRHRTFVPSEAQTEIRQLVRRIEDGDLQRASDSTKAQVLHWGVRLLVAQKETLEQAKQFLDKLHQLDPAADTKILDALLLEANGDPDGALRMLRDSEDQDARSVFFLLLYRLCSKATALEWWNAQDRRYEADFLTGYGRSVVATALMEEDRWEEASNYLVAVHEKHEEWPDLYFLEGAAHTALLLPSRFRHFALEMNLFHKGMQPNEGPEADRLRERATANFQNAEQLLESIAPKRAMGSRSWMLWLRLTHPNPEVGTTEREKIREQLSDPKEAIEFLHVALNFDIPFNEEQIWRYLDQRAKLGGLEGDELIARLLLAEKRLSPRDFLTFLDEEEGQIKRVLGSGPILLARIEALVQDGQTTRARELLEAEGAEFGEADRQRIGIMIDASAGKDPRPELEGRYQATHDLLDLNNLANYLQQVQDWPALRPLLEELFAQHHTLQNALRLVHCMSRDPNTDQTDVLTFLNANQDLVDREPGLQSAKAWALFETGRHEEAKEINELLRSTRREDSDLHLEINLALQVGAWEQFPGIVEREWPRRNEHSPDILIRLATLAAAADVTSDRAFELAKLAVDKASDDPHVLTAAITLVHRLGREGEYLRDWFSRAVALSSAEGPITVFDDRSLVEDWLPAHKEQTLSIERNLLQGMIPLHFAAVRLNIPLSSLLIGIPHTNIQLQDARRHTVIPTFSGAKMAVDIQSDWVVGIDTTSLYVLHYLGILKKTIDSLKQVVLAPDTMVLLLNERTQSKFHQPSRVKAAQEIRELIDLGRLRLMESLSPPPKWLVEEVGWGLARLLHAAQEQGGFVVRPKPIHKLRRMTEAADLRDYNACVLSTIDFEKFLFASGYVDQDVHERAARYLSSQDQGGSESFGSPSISAPIYLDDLAMTYLQSAGLLSALASSGLDLRVSPSLKEEQDQLIARHRQGEQLTQEIDEIRTALHDAIEGGKVIFIPRHETDEDQRPIAEILPAFRQFLQDIGPCDAICIDDRFTNRHIALTDRQSKTVPVICTLDILRYLEARGHLDSKDRLAYVHKLRQSGFIFIPTEIEELEHRLISVQWKDDGTFQESVELRTIRQTLARVRSLNMLDLPTEAEFLNRLRLAALLLIRRIWENAEITIERAVYLSDWLWRHISPSPLDWIQDDTPRKRIAEALTFYLSTLFQPMPTLSQERQKAFNTWAESQVLKPLLPANGDLVDRLATLVKQQIDEWSATIAAAHRSDAQ